MRPGPKPKGKVRLRWTPDFAYAIGLLTADGCLSKDGRHIDFTSRDRCQVVLFNKCLGLKTKISEKYSGAGNLSYHTQFGDVLFYRFLGEIGLTAAKSKTISSVSVADGYFLDFLRGYFDGDGSSYSYYDQDFPNSFRFYISFTSGSPSFLHWLRTRLQHEVGIKGYLCHYKHAPYVQLKYSKKEALVLAKKMYYAADSSFLQRKRTKIERSLRIIDPRNSVQTSVP